jgi:hypothetical protein
VDLPDVPLVLLFGLASAGLFVLSLAGLPMQLRVYRGASARRPRDVSEQTKLMPPEVTAVVRELEAAGFRRLGETILEIEKTGFSGVSWVLADGTGTIQAEIVSVDGALLALGSYFGDRATVTTSYPKGERIREPGFVWVTVKSSVADAVEAHRRAVEQFAQPHGRPVRIASMADYLRWDAIDRELYSEKRLRRPFLRSQLLPIVAYGLAAACLLSGYVVRWP